MKELIDKCEHCGNPISSGVLHCDRCGKGISANFATRYKKDTRKTIILLIICILSVIGAVIILKSYSDGSFFIAIVAFLAMACAMYSFFLCIKTFFERKEYKYVGNTELALDGEPEDEFHANPNILKCPSCGNTRAKKAKRCEFCGYDLVAGESGKSRFSDEELVKNMDLYSKRGMRYFILSVLFLVPSIIALAMADGEFSVYALIGATLISGFLISFLLGIISFNKRTELFKVNVVRGTLGEIIEDCVYRSNLSINRQRIEATGLFNNWNVFKGEDYIRGMYRGQQIEFSDINLEEEYTNSKAETVKNTIFKGYWITCTLGKKLPAVIRLKEEAGKGNGETENLEFNSKYKIYTDNPHYMFYVLTPHFMEHIIDADKAAKARTFFYFAGEMVHIAIYNNRNAFEAMSDISESREQIKAEMKYVTDILDELLLNEYLFNGVKNK